MKSIRLLLFATVGWVVAGCGASSTTETPIRDTRNATPDTSVQDYAAYVAGAPQAWQNTITAIDNRAIDNNRATLGRVLFYDTRLSSNNQVSCSSCHAQAQAFADPNGTVTSRGVNGNTERNSPSLANVALHPGDKMFWDERAEHLVDQADNPIVDTTEMNETFPALLTELGGTDFYEAMFISAFGDTPGNNITRGRIQAAIAEFEKAMVSYSSPFDTNSMTDQQQRGQNAYNNNRNNCSECHGMAEAGASFNMVENAGVPAGGGQGSVPQLIDIGLPVDSDGQTAFKTVSLRNIAVTAPFMHSGNLAQLRDVLSFYDSGGNGGGLTPDVSRTSTDQRVRNIRINRETRDDIEAFLGALTDNIFLTHTIFSDPFPAQ